MSPKKTHWERAESNVPSPSALPPNFSRTLISFLLFILPIVLIFLITGAIAFKRIDSGMIGACLSDSFDCAAETSIVAVDGFFSVGNITKSKVIKGIKKEKSHNG